MQPRKRQKPCNVGLFDTESCKQMELFAPYITSEYWRFVTARPRRRQVSPAIMNFGTWDFACRSKSVLQRTHCRSADHGNGATDLSAAGI